MPTILHFEDDTLLANRYATKFASAGFEYAVYGAPGADPVGIVVKEKPDVILMDVVMPDMDGFEATRLIKNDPRTQPIPLLFLTTLGQQEHINRGKALGAVEYLVKANTAQDDVIDRVRAALHALSFAD